MANANKILAEVSPADLGQDVAFLRDTAAFPEFSLPETIDTAKNRSDRRKALDRAEARTQPPAEEARPCSYSSDLSDSDKVSLGFTHMNILGQVIRNFPASLPGPEKLSISRMHV